MKFSIQLPTDRVDLPGEFLSAGALAEIGACVEQAGFDACYVTDHPAPTDEWLASGGHQTLDPFVALSFVAAATQRIALQIHVLIAAYRNPFLSAKAIATLDVLSGGRVIAGVAAGYLEGEFDALGVDFASRNDLTDERLREILRIFEGGSVDIEGRDFRARSVTTLPLPAQRPHPPIWIGGSGPRRTLPLVARYADVWHSFGTPEQMRAASARIDDLAVEAGRDPSDIVRAGSLSLDDLDTARRDAEAWRDAGYGYLVCGWPGAGADQVERFAREVMPEVNG